MPNHITFLQSFSNVRERVISRPGTLGSAGWSAIDYWTQQIVALLVFIVVGNIIGPSAVGVMTMALLAMTLMMTLLLDGLSDALIQRETITAADFDTTFWLLLGLGSAAGLVLVASAWPMAALFAAPALRHVLPLLAICVPFVGITATYHGVLQRELQFRTLAIRTVISQLSGFAVAVLLARDGFGADSLVGYYLVARILEATLVMPVSGIWPGLRFRRDAAARIIGFGRHRVGNQLLGFVVMQVDRFSAGLFLGAAAVGIYSLAERISSAMINGFSGVVGRVAFPVLAARQSEARAFASKLSDFLSGVAAVALPIFVGLAVTSREIVGTLLDRRWDAAAPLLAVVSLAGIAHSSNYLLTAAVNARGRPDIPVRYSVIVMAVRLLTSLPAAWLGGVTAVAWANLIVTTLSAPLVVVFVRSQIPGVGRLVLKAALIPAVAVSVMAVVVLATGMLLPGQPPIIVLVAKIAAGMISYPALLLLLSPRDLLSRLSGAVARN